MRVVCVRAYGSHIHHIFLDLHFHKKIIAKYHRNALISFVHFVSLILFSIQKG